MRSQLTQLATAVALLIAIALGVHFMRSGLSGKSQPPEPGSSFERRAPGPNLVDIGGENLIESNDDSYVASADTNELFPVQVVPVEIEDGEVLSENDCRAFMAHVESLETKANSSARGDFKSAEAQEAIGALCKNNEISPKFARCALTKSSTTEFVECGEGDVADALQTAKDVLEGRNLD